MKITLVKIFRNSNLVRKVSSVLLGNKKKNLGKHNNISTSTAFLKNVSFEIYGSNNEIIIGQNSKITNCRIYVSGDHHKLIIGENCTIKSGEIWFEDNHCIVSIGNKTTIEDAHIAVTEPDSKIMLGEDCMLSSKVGIRCGDSHSIIDLVSEKRINFARDIKLGNHVWLGYSVEVLKGVTIGSNSIIGARSVVTKDVPNNCVAAGMPAKVIRDNVRWDRKRIYE